MRGLRRAASNRQAKRPRRDPAADTKRAGPLAKISRPRSSTFFGTPDLAVPSQLRLARNAAQPVYAPSLSRPVAADGRCTMTAHSPIDIVDLVHCPGGEAEQRLRRRIAKARDRSGLRAWDCSLPEAAREDYLRAQEVAAAWVTRPASIEELELVIRWITTHWVAASLANSLISGEGQADGE